MKKLLLIRHAKSSWKFPELTDHERPLNARGERDKLTMARYLADRNEPLDALYTSTAVRALDYARVISEFNQLPLVPDSAIYTFGASELLAVIARLPEHHQRVGLVGHNPAITSVVNTLTGAELTNVPTAAIAAIQSKAERWSQLSTDRCELLYFQSPKILSGRAGPENL